MTAIDEATAARLAAEGVDLAAGAQILQDAEQYASQLSTQARLIAEGEAARLHRQLSLETQVQLERTRREARRVVDAEEQVTDDDLDSLYIDRAGLASLPRPRHLIEGVLPRHSYGVLRGRDGTFKSFVALDWSLSLATGRLWHLLPVESVPVLYVAGEGAYGLQARVAAWEERNGPVEPSRFVVRRQALNLHRPGPAFDHLLEHVGDRRYGLVVVDTLRRVSGSADGNSSEMGAVIDSLDQIKQATDAGSVLLIAHTDKGDNDSRGYSGIEDDADFVWHAVRDGDRLALELTKMKDGPDGQVHHLQRLPVGASLVLVPTAPPDVNTASTESEQALLTALTSFFPDGASTTALLEASGLKKATFYRALGSLKTHKQVINEGSHNRPRYVARSLTGSAEVSSPDSPSDQPESQRSHEVSEEVSQVSRPLGSETDGTETGLSEEQRALIERIEAGNGEGAQS